MIAPALASQIRSLRVQADARSVPCGILAWWGRTDFPDGSATAPALAQADWEQWYMRLEQASLVPKCVPPLYQVNSLTRDTRPDGPLPLAIANFRIAVPGETIVARVLRAAQDGIDLVPPPGALATLLEERRAFFACGLLHDQWGGAAPTYRGRTVTYVFDAAFYFTNPGERPPEAIDLDPGDGRGYVPLRLGQTLVATYGEVESVQASVRCRTAGGELKADFTLRLGAQPAAPAPDETWTLKGANGSTGRAYVYRAHGQAQLGHPLIVAEGFPGGYSCAYLYEMLNQHGTLEALRAAGRDVILLGFDNGMDLVQSNAQVAEACIRQAMARTAQPLAVGGVSMGGLIARYALADMEARNVPHNSNILLTVDTPHRGAYTSVCDQWFAHYFASASPLAASFAMVLDSPANQQFVSLWVHGGTAQPSPLRLQFLDSLARIGGYPKKVRRLAVACGSGGGRRSVEPHQRAVEWSGSPFASAELWTLPEGAGPPAVVARGYSLLADPDVPASLSVASAISWEGAPGGQNVYNFDSAAIAAAMGCGTVRDPLPATCSVPTVSALDLPTGPFEPVPPPGNGASPFDDYTCCETDQQHLQFTPEVKRWLLERLGVSGN